MARFDIAGHVLGNGVEIKPRCRASCHREIFSMVNVDFAKSRSSGSQAGTGACLAEMDEPRTVHVLICGAEDVGP
jgi:hypothetical protein